jgi:Domain of unknown function (DUF4034)
MRANFRSVRALASTAAALVAIVLGVRAEHGGATAGSDTTFVNPQQPFIDAVRSMLSKEQFELLDRTAEELIRMKARFPGGDWKLYRFHGALGQISSDDANDHGGVRSNEAGRPDSDDGWERHIGLLSKWRLAQPRSMTAAIALADAWTGYAWKARGTDYADTVTDENWRVFRTRIRHAEDALNEAKELTPKDPQWYCASIDLGRGQGWDRARVEALFRAAVALEPRYLHVYSAYARYVLPRWYGEQGDWERLADESATTLGGREGSVVYGHIAWQISKLYRGPKFYEQNRVSWDRIRQGFVDREALYGPSMRNLNGFSLLATSAGDKKTARELFDRIGDAWDPDTWKERRYFDEARRWVNQ